MASGFVIEHDPLGLFVPGDYYSRGEIAAWLEDGELPLGMRLRNHKLWTVTDHDGTLVLCAEGTTADAHAVRALRDNRGRTNDTRARVLQFYADRLLNDKAPTVLEASKALGIWPSAVRYHITNLEAAGLVERVPYKQRQVWLTDAGAREVGWPGAVRER